MDLSTERIEIEEYKRLLHCIDEFKNRPSFQDETISFNVTGISIGQIPYINKQAKSPRKEGHDSPWNVHVAHCKNDKFSSEQEVRIEVFLGSPYSEKRYDMYLLSPIIKHLKIHCPGISKFCMPCISHQNSVLIKEGIEQS